MAPSNRIKESLNSKIISSPCSQKTLPLVNKETLTLLRCRYVYSTLCLLEGFLTSNQPRNRIAPLTSKSGSRRTTSSFRTTVPTRHSSNFSPPTTWSIFPAGRPPPQQRTSKLRKGMSPSRLLEPIKKNNAYVIASPARVIFILIR
jgi:hypothetical protein